MPVENVCANRGKPGLSDVVIGISLLADWVLVS